MNLKNFVILLAVLKFGNCQSYKIYTGPCRRSDPNLEKCLIKAFEKVKFEFATGNWFSDIQIRPMDPLNLRNHIYGSDSIAKIHTENMTVNGLSNFHVEKYKVNIDQLSVDMRILFPKISDTGIYSGSINLLGVKFNGQFSSHYKNTRAFIRFEIERYFKDGLEFIKILDVLLTSDKKFNALVSSHKVHDVVIPMVYPYLEMSYGLIIRDELNKILEVIPLRQILPE